MDTMHTENHCTEQVSSLWGVALRPGCGHCLAHSHLGRDQCYASQAESVFRMSDAKQESTTSPEPVAIHCVWRKATTRQHMDNAQFPQGRKRRYHPEWCRI